MSARFGLMLVLVAAVLFLVLGAGNARPGTENGSVTITMVANAPSHPAFDVLIPNFERAYPNIKVDITYTPSSAVEYQLESIELAAGNAPDLLAVSPGCGTPISVCKLAKSGYLAPMVKKPWVRRSVPLLISMAKYGRGLFGFEPIASPEGVFTNDELFRKLRLKVPQTFAQLRDVCAKAKANGTAAVIFGGGDPVSVAYLTTDLAVATVYGRDKNWPAELRAGKVSFEGTPGWHRALQEFIDMNTAGCFPPGITGTSLNGAAAEFAQGQGLMLIDTSSFKGLIDAGKPLFDYSFHPLAGATDPNQTSTFVDPGAAVSVNAHASPQAQKAAQTFVDFIARPRENELYAQVGGGLTQYELLKGRLPGFMSAFASVVKDKAYVVNPFKTWWNASVALALEQNGIGLITGQTTIDDVLNAMDAAWKQGPA